jgi:4a-hydroxytetrahydrobiopterin dehydratase
MKTKVFTDAEINHYLSVNLVEWVYEKGAIKRDFEFADFTEAFSFMTSVALLAEKADHHPEWSNVYKRVSISLNTHSAGGITSLDFDLAGKIDAVFRRF